MKGRRTKEWHVVRAFMFRLQKPMSYFGNQLASPAGLRQAHGRWTPSDRAAVLISLLQTVRCQIPASTLLVCFFLSFSFFFWFCRRDIKGHGWMCLNVLLSSPLACYAFLPCHAAWIPALNHSWAAHLPSGGPTLRLCSKSEELRNSEQMIISFYMIRKQINLLSFIIISNGAFSSYGCTYLRFIGLMQPDPRCTLLPVRLGCGCWLQAGCVSWLRSVWPWSLGWFKLTGHCGGTSFLGVRCLSMELYLFQPFQEWYGEIFLN